MSDPNEVFQRIVALCRAGDLSALTLCWNVVNEEAAKSAPLIDAEGRTFARGHWGLFNFSDPGLREISLRSLESIVRELVKSPDVFRQFQPTNEWLLTAYTPHGWSWPAYAGEMGRNPSTQVMYDDQSLARWTDFLSALPNDWREKIRTENAGIALEQVRPPDLESRQSFSAHDLAWARFRSSLIGDYLVEIYDRLKPLSGSIELLSQSAMPVPLTQRGLEGAALGHNPEYWLKRGKSSDSLAVNSYDGFLDLAAYPEHGDSWLEHPASMMYFQELARAYDISALTVSEQGANSFSHSDDGQRYLTMRGALSAASFDLDLHTHLLWNDEPGFEPVHEQFFGIVRDQHLQPKPSAHELNRVRWITERASKATRRPDPQVVVVLPRESMDLGIEGWTTDALTGSWRYVAGITTDSLIADKGIPESTKYLIYSGTQFVSSAATLEVARRDHIRSVIYAGAARFGVDSDEGRHLAFSALTGLRTQLREAAITDGTAIWPESEQRLAGAHSALVILEPDLPPGSRVLCRLKDSDRILAYQFGGCTVTALPIGRCTDELDPALTRWTRSLLENVITGDLDLPFSVVDGERSLAFHLIGDLLTVVNPGPETRRAVVEFDHGQSSATLDVAPGQFSAVQLTATAELALLAGAGKIVVNDHVLIDSDIHAAVLLDSVSCRVEPLPNRHGDLVTDVVVNDQHAVLDSSEGQDVWIGGGGPRAVVRGSTSRRVRTRVHFQRELPLTAGTTIRETPDPATIGRRRSNPDNPARHTLFSRPDRVYLEWSTDSVIAEAMQVRYEWWSSVGADHGIILQEVAVDSRRDGRLDIPLAPEEYPALVSCTIADAGTSSGVSLKLVYEAVDTVDSLATRLSDDVVRLHFLHPIRRERFDIVDATAEVLSTAGEWEDVELVVGYRGMHGRHLQWSEDWLDTYS